MNESASGLPPGRLSTREDRSAFNGGNTRY